MSYKEEAKKQIDELRMQIIEHNSLYYDQDSPIISDAEYDQLQLRLRMLEAAWPEFADTNSPSVRVGGQVRKNLPAVAHRFPMLSLEDVFDRADVENFVLRLQRELTKAEFVVEQKIDGLSVSLRYENGILMKALTRGDGISFGEDVSDNVREIIDVPLRLSRAVADLEVRGEVYMPIKAFEEVNQKQELMGGKLFANPRNCAAGTLRQLDSSIVKERGLRLFVFNVQYSSEAFGATHSASLQWLEECGFKVSPDYRICKNAAEVLAVVDHIGAHRFSYDYNIDGAVIKLDQLAEREVLGATSKAPRWAVAFKYPPEQKETVIRDITLQVGRTGKITPMAQFEPVRLAGTRVSKATLHNQDFINQLGIAIGDTVLVQKSGEIIPTIISVRQDLKKEGIGNFLLPDTCPVCGAPAKRDEGQTDLRCTGSDCPAQLSRHLVYFASRDAMDIAGLGPSTVEALLTGGMISSLADIFYLSEKREELLEKNLIGREKTVDNLLAAIDKAKSRPLEDLITGLGIRNIGKQTAAVLVEHFDSLGSLARATSEQLALIPDIGPISAAAIIDFFALDQTSKLIERLRLAGVNLQSEQLSKLDPASLSLAGKSFVLTGTLPTMDRKTASELIIAAGGKVSSAVSGKTDYVLAGSAAGSKLAKAESLGVTIINEDEFRDLLS